LGRSILLPELLERDEGVLQRLLGLLRLPGDLRKEQQILAGEAKRFCKGRLRDMRIVSLGVFLSLPAGTVFAKYHDVGFDDLLIKGDSLETDFWAQDITSAIDAPGTDAMVRHLLASKGDGSSVSMDFHCESRDGCFEPAQLFAVFERDDLEKLISRLQEALLDAYGRSDA